MKLSNIAPRLFSKTGAAALLLASTIAYAQPFPSAEPESELRAAIKAAERTMQPGPAEVKVTDQAVLKLPANYVFVPSKEAGQILAAIGNPPQGNLVGIIFPVDENDNWFAFMPVSLWDTSKTNTHGPGAWMRCSGR